MDSKHRLVRAAVGAGLLFALVIYAFVALNSLPHTTHPSLLISPTIVTSPEESTELAAK
jgi:hypothetical protein